MADKFKSKKEQKQTRFEKFKVKKKKEVNFAIMIL